MLLRIEDHDRERSRPTYDLAIVEDLDWLGFAPAAGPIRQQASSKPYAAALERLRAVGMVYRCDCTRSTFAAWTAEHGRSWPGPGCPGRCRERGLDGDGPMTTRVTLDVGLERWDDWILGLRAGDPTATGDPPVLDRHGNWTYGFAVVVDDLRQSISLIVRGEDLADATPAQIRLGRLLGRPEPAAFAHHPLIRKASGAKLSKADGDTGIRELRAAGLQPSDVIGAAAAAAGLIQTARPVRASEAPDIVRAWLTQTS